MTGFSHDCTLVCTRTGAGQLGSLVKRCGCCLLTLRSM